MFRDDWRRRAFWAWWWQQTGSPRLRSALTVGSLILLGAAGVFSADRVSSANARNPSEVTVAWTTVERTVTLHGKARAAVARVRVVRIPIVRKVAAARVATHTRTSVTTATRTVTKRTLVTRTVTAEHTITRTRPQLEVRTVTSRVTQTTPPVTVTAPPVTVTARPITVTETQPPETVTVTTTVTTTVKHGH